MGRRRWALTVGLVVVAAVAAVVAVAAANSRANDVEREADALAELEDELARGLLVEEEVSEAKTLLAEHTQVADDARASLTPDVLAAIVEVQAAIEETACTQARQATRNGSDPPAPAPIIDFATATAPNSHPPLQDLDSRWSTMLDHGRIQAAIDDCTADEAAQIEAEARAEAERQAAAAQAEAERRAAAETQSEPLVGLNDCLAAFPDSPGLCTDLDGDGIAGYPDSG